VANAGPDATYRAGSRKNAKASFTLDGTGSVDPDGTITAYQWTLGGSVVGTSALLKQSKPVGTFVYTLRVTDNGGLTASDQVVISVTK
jgi:YD repeat-containing protein